MKNVEKTHICGDWMDIFWPLNKDGVFAMILEAPGTVVDTALENTEFTHFTELFLKVKSWSFS